MERAGKEKEMQRRGELRQMERAGRTSCIEMREEGERKGAEDETLRD